MDDRVQQALARGLHFLHKRQLPHGEFRMYRARAMNGGLADERQFDSTPFVTAMIVYSLGFLRTDQARAVREKALGFLRAEMEGPGLWRYWTAKHPGHRQIPVDLDDTCSASFVLRQNGVPVPANEHLIATNRTPGGLFYTWLLLRRGVRRKPAAWWALRRDLLRFRLRRRFWRTTEARPDDVDGVVNANVLLYLGENETTAPVVEYLLRVLAEGREDICDKWYINKFSFYYAVSRACFRGVAGLGAARPTVLDRLARAAADEGGFGNALDTALAACRLLNLDGPAALVGGAVARLVTWQGEDGAWPTHPMYWGGSKRYYGWGSEELTTALCVEALARYHALRE
jgi:hypothetical protein